MKFSTGLLIKGQSVAYLSKYKPFTSRV